MLHSCLNQVVVDFLIINLITFMFIDTICLRGNNLQVKKGFPV